MLDDKKLNYERSWNRIFAVEGIYNNSHYTFVSSICQSEIGKRSKDGSFKVSECSLKLQEDKEKWEKQENRNGKLVVVAQLYEESE